MLMVIGVVATAVGYELVIAEPLMRVPPAWLVVVLGGPAIFVVGRARFEYEVFGRVSASRIVSILLLVLAFAPLLGRPALLASMVTAVILTVVAVTDALRARSGPPEPPAPPF